MEINVGVFYLSPGYTDKVWELLKEILPEFKLSDESSSESKTTVVDTKLKEAGKEVKNGKEMKDGKEFKPDTSVTALKAPEKSDKVPKGKRFSITMPFNMTVIYKCFTIIAEFNDFLLSLSFTKCYENNYDPFFVEF